MAALTKKSFEYKPPDPGSLPVRLNKFEPAKSDLPHDQYGNPITTKAVSRGGHAGKGKGKHDKSYYPPLGKGGKPSAYGEAAAYGTYEYYGLDAAYSYSHYGSTKGKNAAGYGGQMYFPGASTSGGKASKKGSGKMQSKGGGSGYYGADAASGSKPKGGSAGKGWQGAAEFTFNAADYYQPDYYNN